MNFISQHKESKDVINLDMCYNFFTLKLDNNKKPFVIRFLFNGDENCYETWYYENESDRDLQFKYVRELVATVSIGN